MGGENDHAVPLTEVKHESEDLFQRLIVQYPDILAGDQISSDRPCKWILVSREMGIPDHEGGNSQWFLNHLFIDQDSVPTFVEVKCSTDTRIRREVVAQILDYAANANTYWNQEDVRVLYEDRCEKKGQAPLETLDLSMEERDSFWDKV